MTQELSNNTNPEMLTVRQAAQRGILPERAIRRFVSQGKIKTIKSGRTQYINFTTLVDELNSGEGDIWS